MNIVKRIVYLVVPGLVFMSSLFYAVLSGLHYNVVKFFDVSFDVNIILIGDATSLSLSILVSSLLVLFVVHLFREAKDWNLFVRGGD